jgi:hypothetical protein
MKRPTSRELSERFDDVRRWARLLMESSGDGRYSVQTRSVNHRVIGHNELPDGVLIEGLKDAASLLRVGREVAVFERMIAITMESCPALLAYLANYPSQALLLGDEWSRLVNTVLWVLGHPRPGVYIRQIDLPGVDTKFIERHRGVLAKLLNLALPPCAIDESFKGLDAFEHRYGFAKQPTLIRFRPPVECAALPDCISDVSLPAEEFAGLNLNVGARTSIKVLVVENLINFLSISRKNDVLIIWGAGYCFDELAGAGWLRGLDIFYWGDIDTHGFAILSQFRGYFPQARSILMDVETLTGHRELWVAEPRPAAAELSNLTPKESALYDELRMNVHGDRVRLEQERISYGHIMSVLFDAGLV